MKLVKSTGLLPAILNIGNNFCMVSPLHPQVSFGSDLSNRAPTFDMDLADLFDSEGEPIAYDVANKYFDQDASQK